MSIVDNNLTRHTQVCANLNTDHGPLLELYRAVDAIPGIKKSFIGSGVRYDLLLHHYKDDKLVSAAQAYTKELITRHVSGRLKVAPEHTSDAVLKYMRKPSFQLFHEFKRVFDRTKKVYDIAKNNASVEGINLYNFEHDKKCKTVIFVMFGFLLVTLWLAIHFMLIRSLILALLISIGLSYMIITLVLVAWNLAAIRELNKTRMKLESKH